MTRARFLPWTVCAILLFSDGRSFAQSPDTTEGLPLDELLNTRISTAAKYEQRVTDVPASVTVITAEEIARNGWHTLSEALSSVPGINITYDRGYTYLGARGVGLPDDYNTRSLILINGQPLIDGAGGSTDIGTALGIDLNSISRIEFVRGPGSVLYGSGAMFGVINLILKSEEEASSLMVGGGNHTTIASGRFAHDLPRGFTMSVSGAMQNDDGENRFFKAFDTPETNDGVSVGHDYDNYHSLIGTLAGHGVRVMAMRSSRTKGIPTGWYGTIFNGDQYIKDERSLLSLTAEHRTSARGKFFLRSSYDQFDWRGQFPYPGDMASTHSSSTRLNNDLRYIFDVRPNHRLTFGAEHVANLRASYQSIVGGVQRDIGGPFSVASVYAQSEFQPLHSLSVTAGLRYDRYIDVTDSWNPRGAIVWHMNDANTFKLLYGSAFRLPTVFELDFEEPSQGIIANPSLQPERIEQLELVWEGRLTPEVLVRVSPYRLNMTGLIKQQTNADTGLTQYLNLTDVQSDGVEVQIDHRRSDGLWSYASYTHQNATSHGVRMLNSPANLAKAGISTPTSRALQGALEVIYESGRTTLAGNETSGLFLTNLTLSTALRSSLRLSVTMKNLLDTDYSTPGGPAHPQDTILQNGRTFLVRLKVGG